ncbi:hypothetical protein EDWATA_03276 [Edwardsiella tarda ATCC 23685]|uniref:Uncharacterized protein n=1 Tax=Edwardsiella tarda ATCC 23685 TaxID=500638 RepID=D4F921_EDWTA|nr:hypothetical protein EDWATA_03276 [Edwardsiella tarda ATCC 23685]
MAPPSERAIFLCVSPRVPVAVACILHARQVPGVCLFVPAV